MFCWEYDIKFLARLMMGMPLRDREHLKYLVWPIRRPSRKERRANAQAAVGCLRDTLLARGFAKTEGEAADMCYWTPERLEELPGMTPDVVTLAHLAEWMSDLAGDNVLKVARMRTRVIGPMPPSGNWPDEPL